MAWELDDCVFDDVNDDEFSELWLFQESHYL